MTALDAPAANPGLRRVIDLCLDATDELIALARRLPAALRSTHLAMESEIIVRIAVRLSAELRAGDPLAQRIELNKLQFAACGLSGAASVLFGRLFRGVQQKRGR